MEKTTVESTRTLCSKKRKVIVSLKYLSAISKHTVGTCSFSENDTRQSGVVPTITRDTSVEEPEAIKSYFKVQKSHMVTHIEGLVAYVGQLPAEKLAVVEDFELPGLIEISEEDEAPKFPHFSCR